MNYIRSLTNPEGLYVWRDGRGSVNISEGAKPILKMPVRSFHGLLRHWHENYTNLNVSYKGASLSCTKDYKWRLKYKNWRRSIVMWEVTLECIAKSVV